MRTFLANLFLGWVEAFLSGAGRRSALGVRGLLFCIYFYAFKTRSVWWLGLERDRTMGQRGGHGRGGCGGVTGNTGSPSPSTPVRNPPADAALPRAPLPPFPRREDSFSIPAPDFCPNNANPRPPRGRYRPRNDRPTRKGEADWEPRKHCFPHFKGGNLNDSHPFD